MIKKLKGYKTYIIAFCVAVTAVAQYMGYVTPEVAGTLYGLLGAGGVATMAAKVNRI